ncbi:MAG TPA: carbamoyl-phosphate synthase large subunit [Actinomycetota bacterium]
MPRRQDLHRIMVIGSGPIVIGQACEFDYSGTQACKVLRAEGFEVSLVNSNPATIMTDPAFADRTYVEPLTPESVLSVLEREKPDAILPTLGGQTGLNVSVTLAEAGELDRLGIRLIGASLEAIRTAEDRSGFQTAMLAAGLDVPRAGVAHTREEALALGEEIGYPSIVRASFTLGGGGSGFARDRDELAVLAERGLAASPVGEILIEESIAGWKEFELEVMRDGADNAVIVCSIENVDPMGVHTGDSITVAPQQTLTDREYQAMRDTAIQVVRVIGVETGGSNVQFAVDPATGRQVLIEMNPRVSRSSALASKATGFPIAKIAALLAVGYRLDEIANDITGETPAAFEPTLDYVVVKIPRFAFEKFPEASPVLSSTMKSVGETMAIGRTFKEAIGKAWRGIEKRELDEAWGGGGETPAADAVFTPTETRLHAVADALAAGHSVDEVAEASRIDPWFVDQIAQVVEAADAVRSRPLSMLSAADLRAAKRVGLSDTRLAGLTGATEASVRRHREALGVWPVFKTVDTCAGEFPARTPYHYSTYEEESEVRAAERPRIVILGAGPNRIGQGIEFDYACVHAAYALEEAGFESVMLNSNPETVSTDYDTSSRLYFEPLAPEDVLAVCHAERPDGVIAQLGGQTPLRLARILQEEGFAILGTSPDAIDLAEDRGKFAMLLRELEIPAPAHGEARTIEEARVVAARVGYPVVVRPSYVLGGRAMEIVYDHDELEGFVRTAAAASPDHPVLIDRFLEGAIEVDVDAVADAAGEVFIGGVMEHIEEAGVHSGDSSCQIPPATLSDEELDTIEDITRRLARRLGVVGLLNLQLAVKDERIWVLEANPRASRTVPFVSKAIGVSLARVATLVLTGSSIEDLAARGVLPDDPHHYRHLPYACVKAAVLPFGRFPGVDTVLGPEMKSTGEVMGIDADSGMALAKAMVAAGHALPTEGTVFVSVANRDKRAIVFPAKRLADLGFRLLATGGTAGVLQRAGIPVERVAKVSEGPDNVGELIRAGRVDLVINTPFGRAPRSDGSSIRTASAAAGVPCVTTLPGVFAAVRGIEALRGEASEPRSLQEHHAAALSSPLQVRLSFDEAIAEETV